MQRTSPSSYSSCSGKHTSPSGHSRCSSRHSLLQALQLKQSQQPKQQRVRQQQSMQQQFMQQQQAMQRQALQQQTMQQQAREQQRLQATQQSLLQQGVPQQLGPQEPVPQQAVQQSVPRQAVMQQPVIPQRGLQQGMTDRSKSCRSHVRPASASHATGKLAKAFPRSQSHVGRKAVQGKLTKTLCSVRVALQGAGKHDGARLAEEAELFIVENDKAEDLTSSPEVEVRPIVWGDDQIGRRTLTASTTAGVCVNHRDKPAVLPECPYELQRPHLGVNADHDEGRQCFALAIGGSLRTPTVSGFAWVCIDYRDQLTVPPGCPRDLQCPQLGLHASHNEGQECSTLASGGSLRTLTALGVA